MSQKDKWNWIENLEITWKKDDYNISNKNVDNIVWMYNFVKSINVLEKYEDFIVLKNEVNSFIIDIFNEKLEWKNAEFVRAFEFWNLWLYNLDNEENSNDEYNELFKLIIQKNKFYLDVFSKLLTGWKFDNILKEDEINDSYHIIESWILQYFDELYYNWYQSAIDDQHQEKDEINNLKIKTVDWNPIYWGLKDKKFVWYKEFEEDKGIYVKTNLFEYIKNPELKQYFMSVMSFINSGVTNYHSWVWIDELAIRTWQKREWNFWLITPIENYIHKWLVELETILFLKNKSQNNRFDIKKIVSLSEELYLDSYWMNKVTLDIVETFIEWWQSTVSGFIWKNSPNDPDQSERLWSFILLKDSDVLDSINHALPLFKTLLQKDWLSNKAETYNEIMKHLVYHEFGHNLFIKWNKESKREEAKASLYYYAELWRENDLEEYNEEKIQLVVESALIMWLRDLVRLSNPSAQKHVLRWKVILNNLFVSWLIDFNWDKLEINSTKENFNEFLRISKIWLDRIQKSYNNFNINIEEEYIQKLENKIWKNIDKMLEIIK